MMTRPTARQLWLFHLVWCLCCWSRTADSYPSPFKQWEDGITLTKVPEFQNDNVGNMMWRNHNEEQVQNVFKRFLFHYSKAHSSVGAVQHESHSVHPLMRLSPKLSQRRKKLVLMGLRGLPDKL